MRLVSLFYRSTTAITITLHTQLEQNLSLLLLVLLCRKVQLLQVLHHLAFLQNRRITLVQYKDCNDRRNRVKDGRRDSTGTTSLLLLQRVDKRNG